MADERTTSDAAWAFAIGVLLGVGAALLLGTGDDADETSLVSRLRERGIDAHVAPRRLRRDLDDAIAAARRYAERRGRR